MNECSWWGAAILRSAIMHSCFFQCDLETLLFSDFVTASATATVAVAFAVTIIFLYNSNWSWTLLNLIILLNKNKKTEQKKTHLAYKVEAIGFIRMRNCGTIIPSQIWGVSDTQTYTNQTIYISYLLFFFWRDCCCCCFFKLAHKKDEQNDKRIVNPEIKMYIFSRWKKKQRNKQSKTLTRTKYPKIEQTKNKNRRCESESFEFDLNECISVYG